MPKISKYLAVVYLFGLWSSDSIGSSYDPGPPPLLENFEVSDDVFSGTIESIGPSQSSDRGDSIATVKVINVWKGQLLPGASVSFSFNANCPALTNKMSCVRHTLKLKNGETYAIFTRGIQSRFAARAFGTQEYSKVSFVLEGMKSGESIDWLIAVKRKSGLRNNDLFVASVVPSTDLELKPILETGSQREMEPVLLRVEKVLLGNRKVGEVVRHFAPGKNSYGFGWEKGYFRSLKDKIVVSPAPINGMLLLDDSRVVTLPVLEKTANEIRSDFERSLPRIKERIRTHANVGRVGRSWNVVDYLFSYINLLSHAEFAVGYSWNPDVDAVAY